MLLLHACMLAALRQGRSHKRSAALHGSCGVGLAPGVQLREVREALRACSAWRSPRDLRVATDERAPGRLSAVDLLEPDGLTVEAGSDGLTLHRVRHALLQSAGVQGNAVGPAWPAALGTRVAVRPCVQTYAT